MNNIDMDNTTKESNNTTSQKNVNSSNTSRTSNTAKSSTTSKSANNSKNTTSSVNSGASKNTTSSKSANNSKNANSSMSSSSSKGSASSKSATSPKSSASSKSVSSSKGTTSSKNYSTSKVSSHSKRREDDLYTIGTHLVSGLASLIFLVFSCSILWFIILNVHPANDKTEDQAVTGKLTLASKIDTSASDVKMNILNEYLSENQIIRKIYKIEAGDPVPKPNSSCFGTVEITEAAKVMEVIEEARKCGLLDSDEKVVFNPDIPFYGRSNIQYYFDESILAIAWKEVIEGQIMAMSEIKISDPSQFRRKIAGDSYGSGIQYFCSEMAKQANSVVAFNADFYAFRTLGITCYEGTIYRTNNSLDTLFVNNNGEFIFYDRNQNATKEELQKFVDDNDINFGLSFGPILIRDGELIHSDSYPIGETNQTYTRAGIGLLTPLHYLFMDVENHGFSTITVNTFGRFMYDRGVVQGYNLDGGQTAEIVFNNKVFNLVNYGNERAVSDIIYFATALPEEN